jgi:ankyrin repeat protein
MKSYVVAVFLCFVLACASEEEKSRQQLDRMGIAYSESSYLEKVQSGDIDAINLFIKAGMRPDSRDDNGNTGIILATKKGTKKSIEALMKAGVNINAQNNAGLTALILAASNCNPDMIEFLLKKGADKSIVDSSNNTALQWAELMNRSHETRGDPAAPDCKSSIKLLTAEDQSFYKWKNNPSNES